ncbi:MAG: hypothetical protein RL322_3050 [Pseudomonadota bacterium]|jgi:competence ComEA-like helix-hairpin-helix protein
MPTAPVKQRPPPPILAALSILLLALPALLTDGHARDRGPQALKGAEDPPALAARLQVDANTASAPELEQIKGIGPRTAERIVEARERGGRFRDEDDFRKRVSGVGPARLKTMRTAGLILPSARDPLMPGQTSKRVELVVGQAPGKRDPRRGMIIALPPPGHPR